MDLNQLLDKNSTIKAIFAFAIVLAFAVVMGHSLQLAFEKTVEYYFGTSVNVYWFYALFTILLFVLIILIVRNKVFDEKT